MRNSFVISDLQCSAFPILRLNLFLLIVWVRAPETAVLSLFLRIVSFLVVRDVARPLALFQTLKSVFGTFFPLLISPTLRYLVVDHWEAPVIPGTTSSSHRWVALWKSTLIMVVLLMVYVLLHPLQRCLRWW